MLCSSASDSGGLLVNVSTRSAPDEREPRGTTLFLRVHHRALHVKPP